MGEVWVVLEEWNEQAHIERTRRKGTRFERATPDHKRSSGEAVSGCGLESLSTVAGQLEGAGDGKVHPSFAVLTSVQ